MMKADMEKFVSSRIYSDIVEAIEEVVMGSSENELFKKRITELEARSGSRVLAVVLQSDEYKVRIYPKIHASDDIEAICFSDIYVEHRGNSFTAYNVDTESFLFMLFRSTREKLIPFTEWEIFFTCAGLTDMTFLISVG